MSRNPTSIQGQYGEAFVSALAAAAGLQTARPEPDIDGVDFFLRHPRARGTQYRSQIDVQVKCSKVAIETATHWGHRLETPHFNELAGEGFEIPRFLFLVVVPESVGEFTLAQSEALRLRYAGYWVSLRDRDLIDPSSQQKVTVHIPKDNLLTVDALRRLMLRDDARVEAL